MAKATGGLLSAGLRRKSPRNIPAIPRSGVPPCDARKWLLPKGVLAASNLKVRLLTAAVVVPPLMWLLFLGPAWGFFVLVLVAAAISADELFRMTHPDDGVARAIGILTTLGVSVSLYLWGSDPRVLLTLLFVVPLLGLMVPLWRLGEIPTAALRTFAGVTGPLYIGGLLTALALLRRDAGAVGPHYVFMCLTFAWLADTGGYFFGRFLGKRKLYEAVSPKKTRAGFVGALLGALRRRPARPLLLPAQYSARARRAARPGCRRARPMRRPGRIAPEALHGHQRLRLDRARSRRHAGPHRRADHRRARRLPVHAVGRGRALSAGSSCAFATQTRNKAYLFADGHRYWNNNRMQSVPPNSIVLPARRPSTSSSRSSRTTWMTPPS